MAWCSKGGSVILKQGISLRAYRALHVDTCDKCVKKPNNLVNPKQFVVARPPIQGSCLSAREQ